MRSRFSPPSPSSPPPTVKVAVKVSFFEAKKEEKREKRDIFISQVGAGGKEEEEEGKGGEAEGEEGEGGGGERILSHRLDATTPRLYGKYSQTHIFT
jgi:hypothetical protein